MKHRDDIVNAKLILRIVPTYIPPLSDAVNRDSVPRDFNYGLVTVYLPKFSDFNLGDRKSYSMFTPHKYLTKKKGKNSKIIP
jgi:hypothetical protein